MSEKPLVGKRNNFQAVGEAVDLAMPNLRFILPALSEEVYSELQDFLFKFAGHIVFDCEWAMRVGAEKGITEAAKLIRDPEYYAHKKQSRAESRKRFREKQAAEKKSDEVKKMIGPTQLELNEKRIRLMRDIEFYRRMANEYEIELKKLPDSKTVMQGIGAIQ